MIILFILMLYSYKVILMPLCHYSIQAFINKEEELQSNMN